MSMYQRKPVLSLLPHPFIDQHLLALSGQTSVSGKWRWAASGGVSQQQLDEDTRSGPGPRQLGAAVFCHLFFFFVNCFGMFIPNQLFLRGIFPLVKNGLPGGACTISQFCLQIGTMTNKLLR